MGLFDQFPYTNFHELNLAWILEALKEIQTTTEQFVAINSLKYADPIQWNITSQYEKNTIVIDPQSGTAYISVQAVPLGVALTNEDYWTVVFDLEQFVTKANNNFTLRVEEQTTTTATFPTNNGEWVIWGGLLYEAQTNIIAGDQYVVDSNIKRVTVEDAKNTLYTYIDSIAGDLNNLSTTDKSNLVAAINEVLTTLVNTSGDLSNLSTTDKSNLVAAINEVLTGLNDEITNRENADGDLSQLQTTNKSSLVSAINEVMQHAQFSSNLINVKAYGATGNGSTDDSTAINTALLEAINSGLPLYFPQGVYYFGTPVTIPACNGLTILGSGRGATVLKGAQIFFTADSQLTDHLTIMNIEFRGVTGSTTPLLNFTGWFYRSIIFNCAFYDWYQAIHIYYYLDSKIICCECNNPLEIADSCIIVARNANGSAGANLTIAYCLLQGWQDEDDSKIYGNVGVEIRDGDAVYMDQVDMGRFIEHDVKITAQYRSDNHNFHNCYFDVTKSSHCMFITGTAQLQHVSVNNCWFASSSYIDGTNGAGIYCNARDMEDWLIDSNRFINIAGSGIHILSDNYAGQIMNNQLTNIGTANVTNNNFGIYIETPSTVANAGVVKNNLIYNCTGAAITFGDNTKNIIFDGNNSYNCEMEPKKVCRSYRMNNPVASITAAADLSDLNLSYDTYLVTGTTTITTLPDTVNGKQITLLFNSATPVATSGNIRLSAAFTATAGSSLTLMSFAHGWTEIGRAVV